MTDRPDSSATLEALVERTDGVQLWRRLVHALNGTVVVGAITVLEIPRWTAVWILAAAFLLQLISDVLRLRVDRANELFFRLFSRLATPREATGIASATWYTMGMLLALTAFPLDAALSGILVLAWADPAASYVGRRWGRRAFLGGTAVGSSVFLVVAMTVLAARHPLHVAAASALLVAIVERVSWPIDDNLTVPVACAGAVTWLRLIL